jgi:hypothetical protein
MAYNSHPLVNAVQLTTGNKTGMQKQFEGGIQSLEGYVQSAENMGGQARLNERNMAEALLDAAANHVDEAIKDPEKMGALAFDVSTTSASFAQVGLSIASKSSTAVACTVRGTQATTQTVVKVEAAVAKNAPGINTKVVNLPETSAPRPVKPSAAIDEWNNFLGPEPHANIHPRTGVPDPNRIVSGDGTRSIRYGNHEMNSSPTKHHYHEETWTYDTATDTMEVGNTIKRVPLK